MANRLSNDELRKTLQQYGEDVGPITRTTRSTWERRLSALRKSQGPTTSTPTRNSGGDLNAFSSDDSEIENSTSNSPRKKRTPRTNPPVGHNRSPNAKSADSDIFKKPFAIPSPKAHPRTTPNRAPKSASKRSFDVETSDSEVDSESSPPPLLRKPTPTPLCVNVRRTHSGRYDSIFKRKSPTLSPPDLSPASYSRTSWDSFRQDSPSTSNGYITNNSLSNGPEEKRLQGSTTNYSHCVSWLLLLGAVFFFVCIGLIYMTEVQKTSQMATKNYSKFCTKVEEDLCQSLIIMSRELHSLLTTVAGKYECGLGEIRNLTLSEARANMRHILREDDNFLMRKFDEIFDNSVELFKEHPEWGVKCHMGIGGSVMGVTSLATTPPVTALEAEQAAKSFWCRIQFSLAWTVTKLLLLLMVCFGCFLSYLALQYWRKRKDMHEKMFYEMVENVIEILEEPDSSNVYEPSTSHCKAVVNVRDALIPAKDRKKKLWLWERVVSFIEENESRVSVEFQKIHGEDFKMWRWNPCLLPESENGKHGKVWQGQAFGSADKSKNLGYTPSPCLKIRNMFDPEVEYGDDWQISVRDAILEKCDGNDGIIHIDFDTETNNEGCVFMMCSSPEAAGKAYNDLHCWWFDGKLVTVKYLKVQRYLERFPGADRCAQALKPSNNKRLSLAKPYISSALERS